MNRAAAFILVIYILLIFTGCGTPTNTPSHTTAAPIKTTTSAPVVIIKTITVEPTTIINPQSFDVHAEYMMNKREFTAGENMELEATCQYTGKDPSIYGIPGIIIFNSQWQGVANWYVLENGTLSFTMFTPKEYELKKDQTFTFDITWNLKDYNQSALPPGSYIMQFTIFQPNGATNKMLISDIPPVSILIK
jgi:hypothetical protein